MKKCFMIVLGLATVLFAAHTAHASRTDEWTPRETCVFGMPYLGHAVKKGEQGLITEIIKTALEGADIDFEHDPLPYARALESVRDGTVHCTLDIKNNRKGYYQNEVTFAFYDLSVAYFRKDGFNGYSSMAGKRVAFMHGFDLEKFIPVKVKTQLVYDLSSGFHMLERGHVSYILGDDLLLRNAMFASKLPALEYEISGLDSYEVRVIFSPTEQGRRFRDILDRRLREMLASGELAEIQQEHGIGKAGIERVRKAN